jgi:hypothetical protein
MEFGDSLQFTVWERKRKNGGEEFNAEDAEAQRALGRGVVTGSCGEDE